MRGDFEKAGFQILLVGMGTPVEAEEFRKSFAPEFRIICDPDKELYHSYGLGRGSLANMMSPGVLLRGLRTMSHGHMPGIPKRDVFQLAGVFMIDSNGNIRYSHYSKNVADHPSAESLLNLKNML